MTTIACDVVVPPVHLSPTPGRVTVRRRKDGRVDLVVEAHGQLWTAGAVVRMTEGQARTLAAVLRRGMASEEWAGAGECEGLGLDGLCTPWEDHTDARRLSWWHGWADMTCAVYMLAAEWRALATALDVDSVLGETGGGGA